MNVLTIVSQVLAVPIVFIPVALVWYINAGGIMATLKDAREKKTHKA